VVDIADKSAERDRLLQGQDRPVGQLRHRRVEIYK
jgi:hypothetical protein